MLTAAERTPALARSGNPFDLGDAAAFACWRERKLRGYPARWEELVVEVGDPRALTPAERGALLQRCASANMAIYASHVQDTDKDIPRLLGRQLGLHRLDCNWLADDDGISQVTVARSGTRRDFIPYTDRPIRWHTDGYYNPSARSILAMLLHCVSAAASGGANGLLDHEIAYLLMRDTDPAMVRALMAADAMTIPARTDEDGIARPAQTGPVFYIDAGSGALHMRYTARTRSIEWKADAATQAAVVFLARLLAGGSSYIFHARLESGMGIVCNNVLHDRAAFTDDPALPRLLFRARYYDRIAAP
jgi:Taurine catabolism dioxygenase TauD, TfdA family